MMKALVVLSMSFFSGLLSAQIIENLEISFYRDSLLIDYNISDPAHETYSIELYSSHDDFSKPLVFVKGDIGEAVIAGSGKRIVWEISKELEAFNGPLAVEVRGYFKVMSVNIISAPSKVKRGKEIDLSWNGGRPATGYIFQLFRNELKIDEREVHGNRSLSYPIPKKLKPGSYSMKVISIDPAGSETAYPFRVLRKIPMALQLMPGYGLVGLGIAILTQPDPPSALPLPPDPSSIGN